MSNKTQQVAITGARGFVGSSVLNVLTKNHKYTAVEISRATGAPDLRSGTTASWKAVLENAELCIHLAAYLPWRGDNKSTQAVAEFMETNVFGTLKLFEAFVENGGTHFVFLSTVGVHGIVTDDKPFNETDDFKAYGNYAISKLAAEKALLKAVEKTDVKLTILRVPIVYGANVKGSFSKLINAVGKGYCLPFGAVDNHRDMMGVRNLADLIVHVLDHKVAGTYLVCDRDPVSTNQLIEMIAQAYNRPARMINVPRTIRKILSSLPFIGPITKRLYGDMKIDDSALREAAKWSPPYKVSHDLNAAIKACSK